MQPNGRAPDVSVVVVTWNAREFTLQCLESLETATADLSTEVIVVDNASSDGTPEMIHDRFPYVRLIQNSINQGFAKANNAGLRISRGRYIVLMNSDVIVPSGCIASIYAFMEQDASIGLLGPRMLGPDGTVCRSCMRFPTLWRCFCRALALDKSAGGSAFAGFSMKKFAPVEATDVDVLNGWFWVVRRVALEQVGLLDERYFMYGEDLDWCRRFHSRHWRVVFYPHAKAVHYGGGSSRRTPIRFYIEMRKADTQYWQKHHGRFAALVHSATLWLHELLRVLGYSWQYVIRGSRRSEAAYKLRRSLCCLSWLAGFGVKGAEASR